ncbi:hypothetical protein [uncultured Roseobacter sp.]|uniref:DUF1127 domain-containing protein n=1 Tax=uncultured Roseobacter sp. TaxID=114847 RepID=UPI002609E10E|nr:hypothetical protein [uncultured Roseobacter sp.]
MAMIDHFSLPRPREIRALGNSFSTLRKLLKSRRDLANLDVRQLKDVGITPEAAEDEARRPVWDVPHGWKNL